MKQFHKGFLILAVFLDLLGALSGTAYGQALDPGPPFQPEPFLRLPFEKGTKTQITEGWEYSDEETAIHGYKRHFAVDFAADRGTPVYAAADGIAYSSFMRLFPPSESHKTFKERRVGAGLGHFVEILHGGDDLRTQYGHLQKVAEAIPYFPPEVRDQDVLYPQIVHAPVDELMKKGRAVRRGDLIGWVGDSGLSWGYEETPDFRPDPKEFPSWDETHVHFEVYDRDDRGIKRHRFDPFGLYDHAPAYQSFKPTAKGLWLLDYEGKPRYAK